MRNCSTLGLSSRRQNGKIHIIQQNDIFNFHFFLLLLSNFLCFYKKALEHIWFPLSFPLTFPPFQQKFLIWLILLFSFQQFFGQLFFFKFSVTKLACFKVYNHVYFLAWFKICTIHIHTYVFACTNMHTYDCSFHKQV